jgi:hypothetical protein
MSLHSDTLYWFRANQSLFFLLNPACLAEKQQIQILAFGLTWSGLEPTIYRTQGEQANHYTTDVVRDMIWRYELNSQKYKSKGWLARNQYNVFEWSDMSTGELLFQ